MLDSCSWHFNPIWNSNGAFPFPLAGHTETFFQSLQIIKQENCTIRSGDSGAFGLLMMIMVLRVPERLRKLPAFFLSLAGTSTDRNSARFPSTTSRSFCRWTRRYGDGLPLDSRRALLTSVSLSSQEPWASDLGRVREFLMGYLRGGQQAEPMLQLDEVPPKDGKHTQQTPKHTRLLVVVPDVPVL